MKLFFDRDDVKRLMKQEAETILCPPKGWHVEVFLAYDLTGEARLVKDADRDEVQEAQE